MRLCEGNFANVVRYDGELLHLAAHAHVAVEGVEAMRQTFPIRPRRALAMGRAVLDSAVVHIPDVKADIDYDQPFGEALRVGSIAAAPMLRGGHAIGAISVWRVESQPFTAKQIALLQTFADQAVIAIENVRLFNEVEARTSELTRSVEQLTGSSNLVGMRPSVNPTQERNPATVGTLGPSRALAEGRKTAKALGLTIPPSLLARADQVIE
jgi:two-component system NtrC family sensor kinase